MFAGFFYTRAVTASTREKRRIAFADECSGGPGVGIVLVSVKCPLQSQVAIRFRPASTVHVQW